MKSTDLRQTTNHHYQTQSKLPSCSTRPKVHYSNIYNYKQVQIQHTHTSEQPSWNTTSRLQPSAGCNKPHQLKEKERQEQSTKEKEGLQRKEQQGQKQAEQRLQRQKGKRQWKLQQRRIRQGQRKDTDATERMATTADCARQSIQQAPWTSTTQRQQRKRQR